MKFDTVIIGAGLAGITAAIRLAEEGKNVGLVSAGRSSMHFNSGALGLLGFDTDHHPVDDVPTALVSLLPDHPYSKLGDAYVTRAASDAADLLRRAGVRTVG